jgi:hypothetical protein
MAKKGSLGFDLAREVFKRSVPRVRLYRLPRLSGRYAWLVPFLRQRLPARVLPQAWKDQLLGRLAQPQDALDTDLETVEPGEPLLGPVLPGPRVALPPLLPTEAELQGSRGRYRILQYLGQRGLGQIYQAEQVAADRPVVIKEYWLPDTRWAIADQRQRLATFTQIAGLNLADGRLQDARLIQPWDAIADPIHQRAYLVLPGQMGALPPLRTHLARHGLMDEAQIRLFLSQGLQTLECLHAQKYRLPSGQVAEQLAHGNLSLDSLLIAGGGDQFFIYLCDFALWEYLFDPTDALSNQALPQKDLHDLGQVALQLLSGLPQTDPWPPGLTLTPALTNYLQRLCGYAPGFEDAIAARRALLALPPIPPPPATAFDWSTIALETAPRRRRWPWLAGLLVAALALAALGGLWWARSQSAATAANAPAVCCLAEVGGIPQAPGTYAALYDGNWHYVWKQPGLLGQGKTLETQVAEAQPQFRLTYRPLRPDPLEQGPEQGPEQLIQQVTSGEVTFAVGSLPLSPRLDLATETIAYDGLAVLVPFSYDLRDQSLPAALQGQISFAQLRRLYLGDIARWSQLDRRLPDLPVRLYAPTDPAAIHLFEQRVLQTPSAIARFRERLGHTAGSFTAPIQQLSTFPMLRAVLSDFEQAEGNARAGAIAFAPLSQVFGQCTVYPLALVADSSTQAVSPLVNDDGTAITPQTNLCDSKGSYFPHVQAFRQQRYPLGAPVSVVFRRDNSQPPFGRKFAELLQTEEGQQWLSTAGMVPLRGVGE